jgi:hypothetical protein
MYSRVSRNILKILSSYQPGSIQRQATLNIYTSSVVSIDNKFPKAETKFNYDFIRKHEPIKYFEEESANSFKLEESYDDKSCDEMVRAFEALSYHCEKTESLLSDDEYDKFVKVLIEKSNEFNDEQLIKVLSDLERFPNKNYFTKNLSELWIRLDGICTRKTSDWNQTMLLKVCSLMLRLNLTKTGDFTRKALIKICRRCDRLSAKDLVEAMFYQTICRKDINMLDVEGRFLTLFKEFNINEIGIICLAFFKTEKRMSTNLLIDKIYDKTIAEIDNIQDITLVNILKTLRYSSDPSHSRKVMELCRVLVPRVESCGLLVCLHIALLGTNLQYCSQELMEAVVKRYHKDIKIARLKDLERITFALGLFDFKSESGLETELVRQIVEQLKLRPNEIMTHPKCLSNIAQYLTLCGVIDQELIESVLKPDFIKLCYGKICC